MHIDSVLRVKERKCDLLFSSVDHSHCSFLMSNESKSLSSLFSNMQREQMSSFTKSQKNDED